MTLAALTLPVAAPVPALGLGAYLKNTVCRLQGRALQWSALHGDLGDADACRALQASARGLLADAPVAVLAHDLHPDFPSTRLAQALAAGQGLPARAVQHHRAHLAVAQAEAGLRGPVLGLALDGVGLGSDGQAWGGELLWADDPARSSAWLRLAHLPALPLPGGDRAAREPWRLAAALLWQQGRGARIGPLLAGQASPAALHGVEALLQRGLHCPPSSAAGRWFDAVAAGLGLHQGPQAEAEAAIALERAAASWLADHPADSARWLADQAIQTADRREAPADTTGRREAPADTAGLWTLASLPACTAALLEAPPARRAEAAAHFHLGLAAALARACVAQAAARDLDTVALGGGCFHNRVLTQALHALLRAAGLRVLPPPAAGCGDAGLALGQAWLASWAQARGEAADTLAQPSNLEN